LLPPELESPGFWKLAYNSFLAALKFPWFPLIYYFSLTINAVSG
jgi:hypothetical protein